MKKLILLITLTAMSVGSYAQDEQITEAERIVDKYTGKAGDAIKELATALEQPAEHVYAILVRQAFVRGVVWTAAGCFLLLISITCGVVLFKVKYNGDYFILWPISILALIFGIIIIPMYLVDMLNPEYYAIKDIISVFK